MTERALTFSFLLTWHIFAILSIFFVVLSKAFYSKPKEASILQEVAHVLDFTVRVLNMAVWNKRYSGMILRSHSQTNACHCVLFCSDQTPWVSNIPCQTRSSGQLSGHVLPNILYWIDVPAHRFLRFFVWFFIFRDIAYGSSCSCWTKRHIEWFICC